MNSTNVGGDCAERTSPPMLSVSDYTPDLLFVNETSGSITYKHKNRRDIRSHARRYASKSKAKNGQRASNYVIAPRSLPHIPKRNISTTSGENANRIQSIIYSEVPEVNDSGKKQVSDCSACEKHLKACRGCHYRYHKFKVDEVGMTICRYLWRKSQPSPVTILGAGRKDPFSCLAIENPGGKDHELIDHGKQNIFRAFHSLCSHLLMDFLFPPFKTNQETDLVP
jgi:hypothetical protein